MSSLTTANETVSPSKPAASTGRFQAWRNLRLGRKLAIGFGLLVLITLFVVGGNFFGTAEATESITVTQQVRAPTALDAASARANLLRMLASTRAYLALGDQPYRAEYTAAQAAFEEDLQRLEADLDQLRRESDTPEDATSRRRLSALQSRFEEWKPLPNELFDLRDEPLEREPALKLLLRDAVDSYSGVLRDINGLIEIQTRLNKAQDEITPDDIDLLQDMVTFQFSFAQMISGLRGYVTTGDTSFKNEYETQFRINEGAWERLSDQRDQMPTAQQLIFDNILVNHEAFLAYPEQMFDIIEGEQARIDLYRFREEAVPLTDDMLGLLDEMTEDQTALLQKDLREGRNTLATSRLFTLIAGVVAVIFGALLASVFQGNIAGAVVRLTHVAERIRGGDLEAQAPVESGDEIGILAGTFNRMTAQLRGTLFQVQREKKRADDLLDVVIPIGVDLTAEQDFNRLLEKMLVEAKSFTHADAGVLYLVQDQDKTLEYVSVFNDTLKLAQGGTSGNKIEFKPLPLYDAESGAPNHETIATHVALTAATLNVSDSNSPEAPTFTGPKVFGADNDYEVISYLTIPLKNNADQVLGVLQLINAEEPDTEMVTPFDKNLEQMMESFSSLAVAALEAYIREQSLKQEIKQLKVEIDQAKREREVQQIVDTEVFKDLQDRARDLRTRRRRDRRDRGRRSGDS